MVDQTANISSNQVGNNQIDIQSRVQSDINGRAFDSATKSEGTKPEAAKPEAAKAPAAQEKAANAPLENSKSNNQVYNEKSVVNGNNQVNVSTHTNDNGKITDTKSSSSLEAKKAPEAQAKAANASLSKASELGAQLKASIMEKVNADLKSLGINR
jgi:hypothetical protein